MTSLFYANVTALTDKVWKFVQMNSEKYQFWSLVETHVHDELELRAWDKSARAARLRLIHNPARRAGRATTEEGEIRSNEGGELFMSQFHLQAHRLYETTVASQHLSEPDQTSLDGFVATVVHMTGYSIIIVTLYGLPSLGMRGANRRRFQKIGGLLAAVRLPWILIGDFNMTPAVLSASQFGQKLGGIVRTAEGGVGTCAQKKKEKIPY